MPEKKAVIQNKLGLHARAAALFVQLSTTFESEIHVTCRDIEVDGKSIMGVMMLAAGQGAELLVRATGRDADEAVEKLVHLLEQEIEAPKP